LTGAEGLAQVAGFQQGHGGDGNKWEPMKNPDRPNSAVDAIVDRFSQFEERAVKHLQDLEIGGVREIPTSKHNWRAAVFQAAQKSVMPLWMSCTQLKTSEIKLQENC
jgi:hypothetical protein